jgi:hypothetical protein
MSRSPVFGPDNPHPLSRMKTELVWEGKYDEYGNRRPIKLPASHRLALGAAQTRPSSSNLSPNPGHFS